MKIARKVVAYLMVRLLKVIIDYRVNQNFSSEKHGNKECREA